MTTHEISIDEQRAPGDHAFAAFCTDECGWRGDWHHSDHLDKCDVAVAIDAALDRAEQDGDAHLLDVAGDDPAVNPPDRALFRALPIPTTDANGYAQ